MKFSKSKQFIKSVVFCTLAALIVLSLVFSALSVSADTSVAISTVEDLRKIEENPNGTYHLTNDIVFSGKDFVPMCNATNQFKGVLDGKGYSIVGINISSISSSSGSSAYSGIFAYNAGVIKNLNVENATAAAQNSKYAYTGIVAAVNLGTIENCYVSGNSSNKNIEITAYTGGICGEMLKGEVSKSVSYANVYSSGGEQYTGGVLGYSEKGDITEVASYGSVFANGIDTTMDGYAGGIVGFSRAGTNISNCLFSGGIIVEKTSNSYIGGACGITYGNVDKFVSNGSLTPSEVISHIYIGGVAGEHTQATIGDAYFLSSAINEEITGKGGTDLTAEEFAQQGSFGALDFNSVWKFTNGVVALANLPQPSSRDSVSQLTGIEITQKPKKLEYTQGDPSLDLTGLAVSAVFDNGSKTPLKQNEYTVGGYNYIVTGKQTITISYKGFTDNFQINVKKSSESIILPGFTDGSYQEGNANGVVSTKKPSSNKNNSSKNPDSSTSSSSKDSSSIILGPNVVEDTLEDESNVSQVNSNSQNASNNSLTDSNVNSPKGIKKLLFNPVGLFAVIIIVLFVVGFIVVFIILKFNSKTAENEISNDELKEASFDENDVYNK